MAKANSTASKRKNLRLNPINTPPRVDVAREPGVGPLIKRSLNRCAQPSRRYRRCRPRARFVTICQENPQLLGEQGCCSTVLS